MNILGARNMRTQFRAAVAAAAITLFAAAAAAQGLTWEMNTVVGGGETTLTKFWYMPKKYRIVPDAGTASILRLDTERMMFVDYGKKTYYEMTFADMEKLMAGVNEQMKAMRKQLEALPEEQRKMAEQMMGGHGTGAPEPKFAAKSTGERKTISGYSCTKYVLTMDGKDDAIVWVTKDVKIPEAMWKQMGKDMEVFAKKIAAMTPGGKSSIVERARTLVDGFPIRTERGDDYVTTVTTIEQKNVPPSEFEVPAGFTKEQPPTMEGGGDTE
jgi:hypothetical protein